MELEKFSLSELWVGEGLWNSWEKNKLYMLVFMWNDTNFTCLVGVWLGEDPSELNEDAWKKNSKQCFHAFLYLEKK